MVRQQHKSWAFTLTEVLVVVTIMGLAAAVVVPQMLKPGTMHVQAAVRSIIADILVAQNEAVVRQSTRRVVFNTIDSQYSLTDGDGNPITGPWGKGGQYVVSFRKDSRFSNVRIENVDFGNDPDAKSVIAFDELGVPSSGGTVDVVSGTTRYRISIAPFTGKVTVAAADAAVPSGG